MTFILAADIGGTKTLLQLNDCTDNPNKVIHEQRFVSANYLSFSDVLTEFISDNQTIVIEHACFAVAGPVNTVSNTAKVTNLPWSLSAKILATQFSIKQVTLINDFYAVALGIDVLNDQDIEVVQKGNRHSHGAQLIIGAGTGLGVSAKIWDETAYKILASEAGHGGYSPANIIQTELLSFLSTDNNYVSQEQVLSGQGLVNIHKFICRKLSASPVLNAFEISQHAESGDKQCIETLSLFFQIFGSVAGNLALTFLPYGGLYIAGGITAKNISALKQSAFTEFFCNKKKMSVLLSDIPIYVIKNQSVGLMGALNLAAENAKT